MKDIMKVLLLVLPVLFFIGCSCDGLKTFDEDGEEDGVEVVDGEDKIEGDIIVDPDLSDPEPGDPDAVDIETDEAEVDVVEPDIDEPDMDEPETGPLCGNGFVEGDEECDTGSSNSDDTPDACRTDCRFPWCGDGVKDTGEECDDTSGFCVACVLTPPSGWIKCTDSSGNIAFLFIENWAGRHTWMEFRDHCRTVIEGYSPQDYAFYGLGVFYDQDIWDCISPSLTDPRYFAGLHQDTTAGDYVEPDGGWYWVGYDGTGWTNVAPFDPSNGFLTGGFDNGGGGSNVECTRLQGPLTGLWSIYDFSCDSAQDWPGICMIQF